MKERPKIGIGVLILRDEKVLLSKRMGSSGEGSWCLPGGKLELNESFEDCAKREVKEEVGLDVDNLELISLSNDIAYNEHYITIGFKANTFEGEPSIKEVERIEEIGWFDLDNLPEPLFIPTKRVIGNFLTNRICGEKK